MKHPFQLLVSNKAGELLFTTSQNQIQVFNSESGARIGYWIDDIDTTETIKEKVKKEQERQISENETKEPAKKKRKSNNSEPKVPTPGEGAPKVYNYIRALHLTQDEKHLIAATDSDKAAVIFELTPNEENILKLIKRQPFPKRPSAITTSSDGKNVLLGDKFGDVYSIPIDSEASKQINAETEPILGHVSMLTDLTVGTHEGKEYVITVDRDEHIRISHYPQGYVIKSFLFGHKEFVSNVIVPKFAETTLISGGGDDFLYSWDWVQAKQNNIFDIREVVQPYLTKLHLAPSKFQNEAGDLQEICVSQIVPLEKTKQIAVLVEATKVLVILNLDHENQLTLDKVIEFENTIVAITSSDEKLIVSLEAEEKLLKYVNLESKEIESSESLDKISENSTVEIKTKDEIFPLYTTFQLRKRGEH